MYRAGDYCFGLVRYVYFRIVGLDGNSMDVDDSTLVKLVRGMYTLELSQSLICSYQGFSAPE